VHTIVEGEPLVIRVSSVIIPSATMDYFVPEKLPQPENYLESLVWDREKDIDTLVEMVKQRIIYDHRRVSTGCIR